MNAESYWKQFISSGKIEDYLTYSRISREEETAGRQTKQEGVSPYAGSSDGNGNHLKPDAYR